jgi:hypothetical protein
MSSEVIASKSMAPVAPFRGKETSSLQPVILSVAKDLVFLAQEVS